MNWTLILISAAGLSRPEPPMVDQARLLEAQQTVSSIQITLDTNYALQQMDNPEYWVQAQPGQFVLKYAHGCDPYAIVNSMNVPGAKVLRLSRTGADFAVVEIPDKSVQAGKDFIEAAFARPDVLWAEPRLRFHIAYTPDDVYYPDQWGAYIMYMDLAWNTTVGNKSVKVAVVDEGCDYTHPDLSGNFNHGNYGYDFVDNDSDPYPDDPTVEQHGTHVSGTIAGITNNGLGVAGMAQITLLSVRCLDETGSGYLDDIADGIRWAADQGVRVISMSIGGGSGATTLEEACNYAYDTAGVLLVAASGNDGLGSVSYPASYSACVAIGALDTTGSLAYFSNYGYAQELVAPGVWIVSTVPGGGYDYWDGTSMATPHVSGLAGLLFSADTSMSNQDVRTILQGTAIDMGGSGWDMTYGYGLVDGQAAMQVVNGSGSSSADYKQGIFLERNPASGTVRFLMPFYDPAQIVRIYDASGRVMANLRPSSKWISWTAPRPGVYFAQVRGQRVKFLVK